MLWKKNMVKFYCIIISHRINIYNDSCRVSLGLSDAAMIFPIYVITFEKLRKKVMWKNDTISFYCVNIGLRTNIHNDGCRV